MRKNDDGAHHSQCPGFAAADLLLKKQFPARTSILLPNIVIIVTAEYFVPR